MTKSKQKKLIGIGCIILAAVIAVFGIIYLVNSTRTQEGAKALTVTVVHADETSKDFNLKTDEEYLADALLKEKIAEGSDSEYGLFITTVDGEKADDSKEQWWCITKGGETVNTGASQTVIADGDKYELTLKTGY